LRTVDCICIHSHITSTIEFLTKWIKQRFLIALIEYLSCILLLNNLLTDSGMISDLEHLVLLHHFVGVWAVQTFALNILYYTCVYCVFAMNPDHAFTRISLQNRNCRFNNTLCHKTFQLIVSKAFQLYQLSEKTLSFKIIYFSIEIRNWIALFFPRSLNGNKITDISPQSFEGLSALDEL
jgi:hypothetical protein